MLFPVYMYEEGTKLPDSGSYYVLSKSPSGGLSLFMHRDNGLIKGLVEAPIKQGIPGLGVLHPYAKVDLAPIPKEAFWKVVLFFREVWNNFKSEACIVLYYNRISKEYYLHCPINEVSGAGVDYDHGVDANDPVVRAFYNKMRTEGFQKVGTIHSHCDFNAYHSQIDINDEAKFDGLHITVGHVDSDSFTLSASNVVSNNRFQIDPRTVIEGIVADRGKDRFSIVCSAGEKEKLLEAFEVQLREEWMPKVSRYAYKFPKSGYQNYGNFRQKTSRDVLSDKK